MRALLSSCAFWLVGAAAATADVDLPTYDELTGRAGEFHHLVPDVEEMTTDPRMEDYRRMSEEIFRESSRGVMEEINRRAADMELAQDPGVDPYADLPRHLPDGYRATILISWSLGEDLLRDLILLYRERSDVRFVFRGVPPDMTVPAFGMQLVELTRTADAEGANILLDPEIFAATGIEVVPAVVLEDLSEAGPLGAGSDMGRIVSTATGIHNPDYVFERYERGITDLTLGNVKEVLEEDLIARAQREAAEVLANMTRDPETVRDRFWARQAADLRASGVTPAPTDRERQLHFAWIAPEDIHDAEGRVIARRGQVFIPNDVLPFDRQVFVFDPSSEQELAHVRARAAEPMPEGAIVRVFIVTRLPRADGDTPPWQVLQDLVDEFERPVFVLNDNFRASFQIEHTPTELHPRTVAGRVEVIATETAFR